jgi:flagellar hook assembly protein FlgD
MKHYTRTLLLFLFTSVLVGQPTFTEQAISISADGAFTVYVADVDGDGDMDVLSASLNDDKIAWYENDGSESFTEQDPGYKSINWDATNDYGKLVSAGMYLYQIQAGEYISTKKMVLLK